MCENCCGELITIVKSDYILLPKSYNHKAPGKWWAILGCIDKPAQYRDGKEKQRKMETDRRKEYREKERRARLMVEQAKYQW